MLDYGFANYETTVVAEKGEVIKKVKVEIGTPQEVQAVAAEKITVLTGLLRTMPENSLWTENE